MKHSALSVALLFSACTSDETTPIESNSDPPPVEPFAAGSRLTPHHLDAAGGAKVLLDFSDAALNTRCRFAAAEDGVMRCLPIDTERGEFFTDEACTQRVMLENPRCDGTLREWTTAQSPPRHCGPRPPAKIAMYRRGARLGMGAVFERFWDGTCVSSEAQVRYEVEHVAPETFVGATEERLRRGGEISVRRLSSEDGGSQVVGLWDETRGDQCASQWLDFTSHDAQPCLPPSAVQMYGLLYRDAACESAVVFWDEICPEPGLFFSKNRDERSCETTWTFFETGESVDPEDVRVKSDSCQPYAPEGPMAFTALGSELPENALLRFLPRMVGDGRVKALGAATLSGQPLEWIRPVLFDSLYDASCQFMSDGDGNIYCIPEGAPEIRDGTNAFEDSACTREIVDVYKPCEAWPVPPIGTRRTYSGSACLAEPLMSAFELGEEIEVTEIYSNYGGTCQGPNSPAQYVKYHRVGRALDLTSFAVVTESN